MGRLTHRTSPGWTYFVTTKSWENTFWFQAITSAQIVVGKMLEYRDKGNYLLHDFVLMPNHLHLILTPASASLEKCMQLIKGGSSFEIHRLRGSRAEVWQSGFHESRVKDFAAYKIKADYIRFNPVTAKLVEKPEDWPYSSANGSFVLDPIPQGLKPPTKPTPDVGAKAPTPNIHFTQQGLKPRAEVGDRVGPKGPTPNTFSKRVASGAKAPLELTVAPGLKPRPPKEHSPLRASKGPEA